MICESGVYFRGQPTELRSQNPGAVDPPTAKPPLFSTAGPGSTGSLISKARALPWPLGKSGPTDPSDRCYRPPGVGGSTLLFEGSPVSK